ncbi:hypothetical protein CSKR_100226 [Clonorchis sinensis]|uniref:Uncharacterized protein n=1 Tax=Clonorchis sinensis TaxID=79923 RepID=A0A3R7C651_CLOSI|nr:hypothetical protein CSKR_100226 [Clonorchis sinensis]
MTPEGSTRAGILPGCPSPDRSRDTEVSFEPRAFRPTIWKETEDTNATHILQCLQGSAEEVMGTPCQRSRSALTTPKLHSAKSYVGHLAVSVILKEAHTRCTTKHPFSNDLVTNLLTPSGTTNASEVSVVENMKTLRSYVHRGHVSQPHINAALTVARYTRPLGPQVKQIIKRDSGL